MLWVRFPGTRCSVLRNWSCWVFANYNFAFVKHHQEIHLLPRSKTQPPNRLRLQDWDNGRVIKFYVIKSGTGGLSSAYELHLYIDRCSFISSYVTSKVILRFYLHSYRTLAQYLPYTTFYSYTTYEGALVTYTIRHNSTQELYFYKVDLKDLSGTVSVLLIAL